MTIALTGDVMTGRGIDQILPAPCPPALHEPYMDDARDYVALAARASGPLATPVDPAYVWGDLPAELDRRAPDARVVNLETSITCRDDWCRDKEVHYRMSPDNAACLAAARLDVCVLANNHVLDWGRAGLADTLATLDRLGIRAAGAGRDLAAAEAPAIVDLGPRGRIVVLAVATETSGVPPDWAAGPARSGIALLPDLSPAAVRRIGEQVARGRRAGDVVVLSIHWGPNWRDGVDADERRFARAVIDDAGVDVVHGHSSHHVRGIEVHRGRLILYGCGDLLDDYEGIHGYERFRGELGLAYLPTLDVATGRLVRLAMIPTRTRRLQVTRADDAAAWWLRDLLCREGAPLGTAAELAPDGALALRWSRAITGSSATPGAPGAASPARSSPRR